MAARFWVGGTGNWDSTNTANWSATSGGAGGASVPTSVDTPQFDGNSGTGTVTFTNSGVTVGAVTFASTATGITLDLGAAFTCSSVFTLGAGTLNTNNYNFTASSISSSSSNTRSISLGSSTVSLSGTSPVIFTTSTNLTFNAGTSQINATTGSPAFAGGGLTFYNVTFTSTNLGTPSITGANTFNNLTFTGRTSVGIGKISIAANQTVSGTLTFNAGGNATMRLMAQSNSLWLQRTISAASVVATDTDFRDIAITGAGAPASGTRLGDCKGNSGITFDAAKTVYFRSTTSANYGSALAWSATSGGTIDSTQFPLAQDTAIIPSATYPSSGAVITLNGEYNIGTLDMSGRTTNTVVFATATTATNVYGNWINGTGCSFTGTAVVSFLGQTTQTLTTAGRTFTQEFTINSPSGSVTLQDAFATDRNRNAAISLVAGTFDANGYNVTLSGANGGVLATGTATRTLAIGAGTWVISGSGTSPWAATSTGLTVTGTGTISLVAATAKTFAGGGIQTWPTLNQGGAGALTVTGSNKFADITNTAIGSVLFTGGTTNEFTAFNLSGALGTPVVLGSTNTTQAILKKSSTWYMGANSTDNGNNTGLTFTAGGGIDYLVVSYINGQLSTTPTSSYYGNFFLLF
jgi:hypothetical protein